MAMQRPYAWLARYYDSFFELFRHPMDAARERILGRILENLEAAHGSACDLACGTGTTAIGLARRGFRMFAVDLSPAMCRLAREKAKSVRVALRVVRGDMRTFRLPEPVDLITCECDALNHVPRRADLARVTRAAARALKPGGYLFFDVNLRRGFQKYWTGTWWMEQPGAVLVMRNGNDAAHDRAWIDVEWFLREGNLWRRHRERVEEVCWSVAEIRAALALAGFDRVRTWDAAPFFRGDGVTSRGCRSIFLARKANVSRTPSA